MESWNGKDSPAEFVCGSGWTRLNDCTPVSSYWSMIDFQVVKMAWMGKKNLNPTMRNCLRMETPLHAHTHTHTLEICNLRTYKVGI